MTRFVVDCDTLLRIAAGEVEVADGHQLVAPTLVRSQALSAFVTSDSELARAVSGIVETAAVDALNDPSY